MRSARAAKAMVQLRGGMTPFPEAFLFTITTQSDEPPAGVFDADLKKARDIRDGKRTGATLPVLYEFPPEVQSDPDKPWRDPANWPQVLPNLGLSVRLETLVEGMADAEAKGDEELRIWASQHLDIEIGVGLGPRAWAGAEHWEQNADGPKTLHGITTHNFPNMFFSGYVQGGLNGSVTEMFSKQVYHASYIIKEALDRGWQAVEPTQQAQDDYVRTFFDVAADLSVILNECTPSYFTNEGDKEAKWFLFRGWGPGWDDFQRLLADWRAQGNLPGMKIDA